MEYGATSRCPNTGALIFSTPEHVTLARDSAAKVEQLEDKLSKLEEQNARLLEAVSALLNDR